LGRNSKGPLRHTRSRRLALVAACNATDTSGCRPQPVTLSVPGGPDGLAIDQATDTLFVAKNGSGKSTWRATSVSVINASTCSARRTSGCDQRAPTVLTGANPGGNTGDQATDTLYVTTFDNSVQVINAATCNAARPDLLVGRSEGLAMRWSRPAAARQPPRRWPAPNRFRPTSDQREVAPVLLQAHLVRRWGCLKRIGRKAISWRDPSRWSARRIATRGRLELPTHGSPRRLMRSVASALDTRKVSHPYGLGPRS
jgi:DNA-binding beta-propeller fold protein YncE